MRLLWSSSRAEGQEILPLLSCATSYKGCLKRHANLNGFGPLNINIQNLSADLYAFFQFDDPRAVGMLAVISRLDHHTEAN